MTTNDDEDDMTTPNTEKNGLIEHDSQIRHLPATPNWMVPANLEKAHKLAEIIARSDLAPKDYKGKPGNVLIAMGMGAELGLSPMAAIQNIAVINGRPSLWGDAMLAVCQRHPDWVKHEEWYDPNTKRAHCKVWRRGNEKPHEETFSVAEAECAGLWGKAGPWKHYPRRMLQMRARSWALRNAFADALRGIGSAEEYEDVRRVEATVRDATPTEAEQNDDRFETRLKASIAKVRGEEPGEEWADADYSVEDDVVVEDEEGQS